MKAPEPRLICDSCGVLVQGQHTGLICLLLVWMGLKKS